MLVLAGGWAHRWLEEDAFINLRIVEQVMAGNGPVFNAGERIEAFTSPLWLVVLVAVRATSGLGVRMEWATVAAGLATAVGAFALGAAAARRLHPGQLTVPLGLGLVAAVPVVWDFATSGLEVGLSWLWLAGCWWVLLHAATDADPQAAAGRRLAPVVLGLGPLVRPDLGLVSLCLVGTWVLIRRPPPRRVVVDVALCAALPLGYQVFRMGYYASLVPSTALAKSAGERRIGFGLDYAYDLAQPYWLWFPLVIIAAAILGNAVHRPRPVTLACSGMVAAAAAHALYFVYIGGDYMHGRLLLPALFALALPASVGLRPGTGRSAALVALGVLWAIPCIGWMRYDRELPSVGFLPSQISDRRLTSVALGAVVREPTEGEAVRRAYERGERGLIPARYPAVTEAVPAADEDLLVVVAPGIGIFSYQAGTDVWVIDVGGLAEPLSARSPPRPGIDIPGHRKSLDTDWYDARFGARRDDVDEDKVAAARRALQCPPLEDLLDAVTDPLTPGRFLANIWASARHTRLVVPIDPRQGEQQLCDREPPRPVRRG